MVGESAPAYSTAARRGERRRPGEEAGAQRCPGTRTEQPPPGAGPAQDGGAHDVAGRADSTAGGAQGTHWRRSCRLPRGEAPDLGDQRGDPEGLGQVGVGARRGRGRCRRGRRPPRAAGCAAGRGRVAAQRLADLAARWRRASRRPGRRDRAGRCARRRAPRRRRPPSGPRCAGLDHGETDEVADVVLVVTHQDADGERSGVAESTRACPASSTVAPVAQGLAGWFPELFPEDNGLVGGPLQAPTGWSHPNRWRTALRPAGRSRRGAVERCGSADPRSQEVVAWLWTVVLACLALPCTSAAADLPSSATVVAAS